MSSDTFHPIEDIADEADVDPRTVRRWIAAGLLDAYKLGGSIRIARSDFEAFLQSSRIGPKAAR